MVRFLDGPRRALIENVEETVGPVRLIDATVQLGVPTVCACVFRIDPPRHDVEFGFDEIEHLGWACHTDIQVAIESAVCEALQTRAANAAGAREDLLLSERSLGRYDRPKPLPRAYRLSLSDSETALAIEKLPDPGAALRDVRDDLSWTLRSLARNGVTQVLWRDLTPPSVDGAYVARILVPGLSDINAYYMTDRVRRMILADFLGPRGLYLPGATAALPRGRFAE